MNIVDINIKRLSFCFGLAETNKGFIKVDNNEISVTTDPQQRASCDQVVTALSAQLEACIKQGNMVGADCLPALKEKAIRVICQYGSGSNKVHLLRAFFAIMEARVKLERECSTFKSSAPTKSSLRGELLMREWPETASPEDIDILSTPRHALINLQGIQYFLKMVCEDLVIARNRVASLEGHELTYDERGTKAIFCNAKGPSELIREVKTVSRELQNRRSFDNAQLTLRVQKIAGFRGQEGYDSCVAAMVVNELSSFLNRLLLQWDGSVDLDRMMFESRFESLSYIPKKRYEFFETIYNELKHLYKTTEELPIKERYELLGKWATACLEMLGQFVENGDMDVLRTLSERVVKLNDKFVKAEAIDAAEISKSLENYKTTAENIRQSDRPCLFITEILENPIPLKDPNNRFDTALLPPRKTQQPKKKKGQPSTSKPRPPPKPAPARPSSDGSEKMQAEPPVENLQLETVVQKMQQLTVEPEEISADLRYLERVERWFTLLPNPFTTDPDYIGKSEGEWPQIIFGHAFAQIVDFFYNRGANEFNLETRERRFQVMGDVTQAGKTTYVSFTYTKNRYGYFYHRWFSSPNRDSVASIDTVYVENAKKTLKAAPMPDITVYKPRTYAKDGSFVINQLENIVFIADPTHGALIRLVLR